MGFQTVYRLSKSVDILKEALNIWKRAAPEIESATL